MREAGKVITTGWFRHKAKALFIKLEPDFPHIFTFSNGWWINFKHRHCIIWRRITKQATRRPEDYIRIVNNFLQFIRQVSQARAGEGISTVNLLFSSPTRRWFKKWAIINLNKTPIPFEYLDGFSWSPEGVKTGQEV